MPETAAPIPAPGQLLVHPTHGVGSVQRIGEFEVVGERLTLVEIVFPASRMTLRVAPAKLRAIGLRPPVSGAQMAQALAIMGENGRNQKANWTRRAQELTAKLRSGDPLLIAEVARDVKAGATRATMNFSEQTMLDTALRLLAGELAVVEGIGLPQAAARATAALKLPPPEPVAEDGIRWRQAA